MRVDGGGGVGSGGLKSFRPREIWKSQMKKGRKEEEKVLSSQRVFLCLFAFNSNGNDSDDEDSAVI